nr:termination factor Rho [uncultured Pseudomonas sp.]
MPQGDKTKYTAKQKRKAEHIEQQYQSEGLSAEQAQARAWATVNKQSGGGEKAGGSGRKTSNSAKASARSDSAKRAAKSREGHDRMSKTSLESQTKESLLKQARTQDIKGRSSMSKAELIAALQHHAKQ